MRSFELALDEISVSRGQNLRIQTFIPAKAGLAELKTEITRRKRTLGDDVELVLYEVVDGQRTQNRRIVTTGVYFEIKPGQNAAAIGRSAGASRVEPAEAGPLYWIAHATDSASALELAETLKTQSGVAEVTPLLARQQHRKFVPNDTLFTNQWHLLNTGQFNGNAGVDVRITNAWDTYRGSNILIGIVDDGLQTAHPDLAANVNTTIDWDFNFNDNDPNHTFEEDGHGTACAGVAAAVGNNNLGVSGAAPSATLVGLRLISLESTDAQEAAAMNWSNSIIQIKSNSWGPYDDGARLEGPGPLTAAALSNACTTGRGGLGILNFWAGGNGLQAFDNSNYDGYANSIYTIAIGAVGNTGTQSYYSEPGANLVVCAPSSGRNNVNTIIGIWTTDRTGSAGYVSGDYDNAFGGTSSATPLAAGVGALILESKPTLGWRDVQEILIRSATRNHPADSDWRANGAGIWFNHKYGGGMINATGAIAMAVTWTNLGPQIVAVTNQTGLSIAIPDNNLTGITRTFVITNTIRLEHVVVNFSATHTYRGDLYVELVSPYNTTSVLAAGHNDSGDNFNNWKFMSVRHWGELSVGTWRVRVADVFAADTGTVTAVGLTMFGSTSVAPSNQPPVLAAIGNQSLVVGRTLAFEVSATDLVDNDPITLTASNLPPLATFVSTNGNGWFNWENAGPIGVYTSQFHAADKDGSASESVIITVISNQPPVLFPVGNRLVIASNNLAFAVTATDPVGDDPITLTASNLPPGATFGATNGAGYFAWPNASPTGEYSVSFHAADLAGVDSETIVISVVAQPTSITYAETFDATENWGGGNAGQFTSKTFINNGMKPDGDTFSANSAIRDTTDVITGNAWRLGASGTANLYFRYTLTNSVTRFALRLARWDNSPTPNFSIRYSTDSGANYTTLLNTNGSWFTADRSYKLFDSDVLNISPDPGKQIWIELFRSSGERMLVDNFEVDYIAFDTGEENGGGVMTNFLFQGFEPGDNWTIVAGAANASSSTGPGDTPANQRIRTGSFSWQVNNASRTVQLAQASIAGYTGRTASVRVSSTSTNATNGADVGDTFRLYIALNGAAFSATPDITMSGNNNLRWGYWATNIIATTAGVPVSRSGLLSNTTTTNAYANLFISIPDTATSMALRIVVTNNASQEYWNVDDISVSGYAIPTDPDADGDSIPDEWELFYFGSITNINQNSDWDGDGFIDLHEYLAGTDPTDIASFLHVDDSMMDADGGIVIQWPGVTGKFYSLSRATNLMEPVYEWIATNLPGIVPMNLHTDTAPVEAGATYRIELVLPPGE
ncbi:MAG TPA: S8 family peptidase [Kiritimatiellia bacterium]|nr:S8 family peptidase [Kiritimatiellia bacterium]